MLLSDIFEKDDSKKASLQHQIAQAKQELIGIQKQAVGPAAPQYASRIDRAKNAVKDLEQKLELIVKSEQSASRRDEFANDFAANRIKETPEEKKKRISAAMSSGAAGTDAEREKYGGWVGLAAAVHKYVVLASKNGAHKVTGTDIAHHFNTSTRTADKWLERPEFTKTARLLGRFY